MIPLTEEVLAGQEIVVESLKPERLQALKVNQALNQGLNVSPRYPTNL